MKIHEIVEQTPKHLEVPYYVWVCFGEQTKSVLFAGKDVSLGEDFKPVLDLQMAVEWYVDQLGGKVKWGK